MQSDSIIFQSVPIASVGILPEESRILYIRQTLALPKPVREILFSSRTGAYIRGLVRGFNIPIELAPKIAFAVLQVAIGEKRLLDLSASFQQELGVAAPQAQAMAGDIEKELFAPVRKELDEFLARQAGGQAQKGEKRIEPPPVRKQDILPNTLDLRDTPPNP